MKKNKNTDPMEKLSQFAFTMSIIGICTIGICPAFAAMGIAVPVGMKKKKVQISPQSQSRNKKALIGGVIALFLFVVDLVLVLLFKDKF